MESGLVSMANQFSGLPMEDLIGGPLHAAATANAQMALTQTEFLLKTCFNKITVKARDEIIGSAEELNDDGSVRKEATIGQPAIPSYESYSPRMIKMSLKRGIITPQGNGTAPKVQYFTTEFDLPMLTVVPLNSLAVDDIQVNFEMEVKSSFSEDKTEEKEKASKAEVSVEASFSLWGGTVGIKGSVSKEEKETSKHNQHYEKSNSAKYTVSVHAGQIPLPKGVNTIIDAFANAIEPLEIKEVGKAGD